jgi:hypothetical protein
MALNGSNMMYSSKASRVLPRGSKETAMTIARTEKWGLRLSFLPEKGAAERLAQQAPRRRWIDSSDSTEGSN